LDSHQHDQRARCPIPSHGSLDRHPNDRLGRIQRQLFEYRRQILRAIRANTYTYTDTDRYSYSDTYSYTNPNANS
jgi:hypothetical protein